MQLVTYRSNENWRAGVEVGGRLVDSASLGPYPTSVKEILTMDPSLFEHMLEKANDTASQSGAIELSSVVLGPPIPDPEKIICLGLNYRDHAEEAGLALPAAPVLFAKYRNSLIGPYADIVVPPAASAAVDYEAELAVVISRRASRVQQRDALDYVAGYSVFNDVSARDLQLQTSQWAAGKAVDSFAPMGPGIVPARFVGDPQSLTVTTRVNGLRVQHESTAQMIFTVAETIAFITQFMTLEPGDVIATGTPAGIGFARKPPVALRDGDVVEVDIEKVGTLRNRVSIAAPRSGQLIASATASA